MGFWCHVFIKNLYFLHKKNLFGGVYIQFLIIWKLNFRFQNVSLIYLFSALAQAAPNICNYPRFLTAFSIILISVHTFRTRGASSSCAECVRNDRKNGYSAKYGLREARVVCGMTKNSYSAKYGGIASL